MLTRQESERKHKAMLIDEGHEEDKGEDSEAAPKSAADSPMKSSKISYFQKTSPKERKEVMGEDSRRKERGPVDSGSQEIKKLLEGLIANNAALQKEKNMIGSS